MSAADVCQRRSHCHYARFIRVHAMMVVVSRHTMLRDCYAATMLRMAACWRR